MMRSKRKISDAPRGVRLQKALADAGRGARRDCEQMILAGRVRVNGRSVERLPCFIDPAQDVIELDGAVVELPADLSVPTAQGRGAARAYVLINKPKGVTTAPHDPQGRRTVLDLLPPALRRHERLFPVGRLDTESAGLLLITNDGDLAYALSHARSAIAQEYRVLCAGLATEEHLRKLRAGMYLVNPGADGSKTTRRASMESVRILKRHVDRTRGDRTLLGITMREGQNREVRRMLARVGLKMREIERVAIGPLRIAGLKPGQAKLLGKKEIEKLRGSLLGDG